MQAFIRMACTVALAVGVSGVLQAQTADELVAKNLLAKGGLDKLKGVQAMRISGRLTLPGAGMEIPMSIITKRPNRFRQESVLQENQRIIVAFDGTKAWMINPMLGTDAPQEITGDRLEMVKQQADLDGPLVDYKTKGTTLELEGTEQLDGRKVNKLKVTTKSGRIVHLLLDDETGLEAKTIMEVPGENGAPGATMESIFSNYQDVGGLKMPHSIQQKVGGQVMQITIDKIELSPPVEDSLFAMPPAAPRPGA